MRPVFPALAALAWGEPRRRDYWEKELLNALVVVERGWSTPDEMRGSGPAPWATPNGCRRSGSTSASITTRTAGCRRSAVPPTRLRARRATWSPAASIAAANTGATRFGRRLTWSQASAPPATYAAWQAAGVTRSERPTVPAAPGHRQALGADARRSGVSPRAEFLCGAQLQPVDELHAGDHAPERPIARRRPVRAAVPRQRTHADARRASGNPDAPDRPDSTPAASMAVSATTRWRRSRTISARSAWLRPMATPG